MFETPGRLVAGTWKIGGDRRAEKIISARTRFRHARACSCPIMRVVWTRQRKNHAEKVRRKSAFIRKPLAEPWTQTLDISNDFQEIQQADLFSYVKSQGITDKSKAWKKALFPTPARRPLLPIEGMAAGNSVELPPAGGFMVKSVVFPTHPAREAVSTVGNFVAFPAAERAAHRHAVPHKPARDQPHHQPSDQHRHQRGDVMALQPVPEEHNEPAKDSASDDRPEKAENKMARGTHATPYYVTPSRLSASLHA